MVPAQGKPRRTWSKPAQAGEVTGINREENSPAVLGRRERREGTELSPQPWAVPGGPVVCVWVLLQEKASLNLLVKPKLDKLVSHPQPRQLQAVVSGSAILPFPLSSLSCLNPATADVPLTGLSTPGKERMEL